MISRRSFLKAIVASAYPLHHALAHIDKSTGRGKTLNLYCINTCEKLNTTYYSEGRYDAGEMEKINYLLRCPYTDEAKTIDLGVVNLLCDIKDRLAKEKTVKIISGYRSFQYNEFLRRHGRAVNRKSLHIKGRAIDFAIEGFSIREIAKIAKSFGRGGVGVYRDFLHIDIGPVRHW